MQKNSYFIGLDIACDDFVASIYESPEKPLITKESIENNPDGFSMLISWLKEQGVNSSNSVICMEATGVYSEAVAHYLATYGFRVSIEPPLKVKRAFDPIGHKTDSVDSRQIAEYAYRYSDELRFWQPTTGDYREDQAIANGQGAVYKAKHRHLGLHQSLRKTHNKGAADHKRSSRDFERAKKTHIKAIDKELDRLIRQNPIISQITGQLKSIPGVGLLLASDLIAITGAFNDISSHKTLAAFLGICPYQHQSGKSVYRQPHMRNFGPNYARKLLMLAARSCATHNIEFRKYYMRKLAEGKAKQLVLNNISNKIIKIACALIKNNAQYNETYRSVNPLCFNLA